MKRTFHITAVAVLAFALLFTASCGKAKIEKETASDRSEVLNRSAVPLPDSTATFIAYYFYTTQRCPSCYKIETYTHETIENDFAGSIAGGRIIWKMINTDQQENEHFIKEYKLYTKSVVLSDFRDGKEVRWKNLDKVWSLLNNKEAFQNYIRSEVQAFTGLAS